MVPGGATFGGAFSIAFWALVSSINPGPARLFALGQPYNVQTLAMMENNANSLEVAYWGSDLNYNFPPASLKSWNHYAVTVDATGLFTVYVNGAAAGGTFSNGGAVPSVSRSLYLGKSTYPGDPFLAGSIRDFQLAIGAVFSPTDVANLFAGNGCPLTNATQECTDGCSGAGLPCLVSGSSPLLSNSTPDTALDHWTSDCNGVLSFSNSLPPPSPPPVPSPLPPPPPNPSSPILVAPQAPPPDSVNCLTNSLSPIPPFAPAGVSSFNLTLCLDATTGLVRARQPVQVQGA